MSFTGLSKILLPSSKCLSRTINFNHPGLLENMYVIDWQHLIQVFIFRFQLSSRPFTFYVPSRDIGAKTKRRRTHPFRWWFKRRADSFKPELTDTNQEFLTDYMKHKFGSPLIIDLENYKDKNFSHTSKRVGVIGRKIGINLFAINLC